MNHSSVDQRGGGRDGRGRLALVVLAAFLAWRAPLAAVELARRSAAHGLDERVEALTADGGERLRAAFPKLVPLCEAVDAHVPRDAGLLLSARVTAAEWPAVLRRLEREFRQPLVSLLFPRPILLFVHGEDGQRQTFSVPADLAPHLPPEGIHVLQVRRLGDFPWRDRAELVAEGPRFRLWWVPHIAEDS